MILKPRGWKFSESSSGTETINAALSDPVWSGVILSFVVNYADSFDMTPTIFRLYKSSPVQSSVNLKQKPPEKAYKAK